MRIAIIDDTTEDIEILKNHIINYAKETKCCKVTDSANYTPDALSINTFNSGSDFFSSFQPHLYDYIFLDIFMPDDLGIEVAKQIRIRDKEVKLVFCSTSNDFASESYEVSASYYLCKPYTKEQFKKMFNSLMPKHRKPKAMITLPNGDKLAPSDIMFTNYFNHKVTVKLTDGSVKDIWITQSTFLAMLSGFPYLKACNRGTIVNFLYVKEYNENFFILQTGEQIFISRRLEKEVKAAYTDFLFKKVRGEFS